MPARKKASTKRKKAVSRKATVRSKPIGKKRKVTKKKLSAKKASKKKVVPRKKLAAKKASKKKPAAKKKAPVKKPAAKKASKKKVAAKKTVAKKAKVKKTPAKKAAVKKVRSKKAPAKKASLKKAQAKKAPAKKASVKKVQSNKAPAKKAPRKTAARKRGDMLSGPIHGVSPYEARRGESYMGKEQLSHFGDILTSWKNELMQEVDRTVHHMQDEAANFPDPNDRATQESEFGLELRTRDRERKLLRKILSALARIDDGNYGYCEETGEEIGLKRLEARPVATLCVEAQERREMAERQYRDRDDRYR